MQELPLFGLVFAVTASVALLALATAALFRRREVLPDDPPAPRVFGPFTPAVAALLPQTRAGRDAVAADLVRAGFFEPTAEVNFTAVRAVLTYLPLLAGLAASVLTVGQVSIAYLLFAVVTGVLGFAVPRVALSIAADGRSDRIRRGLPMLMDTLGLTLSTGATLPAALAASGEAVRRGFPELSHEVRVVLAQAELRSLSDALERWRRRQPIPELGSLVFLLSQADRLGTDVTRGLWELSASLQVTARQRAEAAANRANFYMAFPTVLCLLIAAALVIAGPGVVQIVESNRVVDKYIEEAQEQERKLEAERKSGRPVTPAPAPGSTGSTSGR
ncbi:MAG TPA: type II secretion system F family protein [Urbifossiella sp.]|nr:type II secretion system F family protein [Urbifossiella sp.]